MNLFQNLISVSNVIYSSFFLPHFTCRRFVYFIALISKPIFHFFFEGRPTAFIWSFFHISLIFLHFLSVLSAIFLRLARGLSIWSFQRANFQFHWFSLLCFYIHFHIILLLSLLSSFHLFWNRPALLLASYSRSLDR